MFKKHRLWIGACVAALAVLLGNRGFRRVVSESMELRRMRHELAALQTEETSLRRQISDTRRNDFVLESAARRELGYLRPGEVEYRFPPPPAAR